MPTALGPRPTIASQIQNIFDGPLGKPLKKILAFTTLVISLAAFFSFFSFIFITDGKMPTLSLFGTLISQAADFSLSFGGVIFSPAPLAAIVVAAFIVGTIALYGSYLLACSAFKKRSHDSNTLPPEIAFKTRAVADKFATGAPTAENSRTLLSVSQGAAAGGSPESLAHTNLLTAKKSPRIPNLSCIMSGTSAVGASLAHIGQFSKTTQARAQTSIDARTRRRHPSTHQHRGAARQLFDSTSTLLVTPKRNMASLPPANRTGADARKIDVGTGVFPCSSDSRLSITANQHPFAP